MKSYRFRLASVSRVRALEERLARERFLTSLRTAQRAELAYRCAHDALKEAPPLSGTVSAHELRWSQEQAKRQADVARDCLAAWKSARELNVQDREVWREAAKRARALERLDERARLEWLDEYRREEALELDDVVNGRYTTSGGRR